MTKKLIADGNLPSPYFKTFLNELNDLRIKFTPSKESFDYFRSHRRLARALGNLCAQVRGEFGPATELSLEMYQDPETGERYPTLYVRQKKYQADLMERIEEVSDLIRPLWEKTSGYFLLTTDFRKPGMAHGL
jgi:hypothetical protein